MPKIIPLTIFNPRSLLGYDGTDFRMVKIDTDGQLSVVVDNQLTDLANLLNALKSVNTDKLQVRGSDQLISYKGRLCSEKGGAISGNGGYLASAAVPADTIWHVTRLYGYNETTATTVHIWNVSFGNHNYPFYRQAASFGTSIPSLCECDLWLVEGDVIRLYFTGGLANDTCRLWVHGHTMSVES
jgi:hypothetical protein